MHQGQLNISVHGDIRHLEMNTFAVNHVPLVHGDIRHLEITLRVLDLKRLVHGDIRHLES